MDKEDEVILNRIIRKICEFGDGETEFHTRDIEFLVERIEELTGINETLEEECENLTVELRLMKLKLT